MRVLLLSLALLTSGACASLQSVSFTEMPVQRNHQVSADVSKTMFLLFSFNNDFLDELQQKLQDECKGGSVEGIMTKHENYNYFIINRMVVKASGYCVKQGKA